MPPTEDIVALLIGPASGLAIALGFWWFWRKDSNARSERHQSDRKQERIEYREDFNRMLKTFNDANERLHQEHSAQIALYRQDTQRCEDRFAEVMRAMVKKVDKAS